MDKSSSVPRQTPTMWRLFQQDTFRLRKLIRGMVEGAGNWLFEFTRNGAQRRVIVFLLMAVVLWLSFAMLASPIRLEEGNLTAQVIAALFAPRVLRHALVMVLGMFVGLVLVSRYLDDLFELKNVSIAQQFLIQALFLTSYETIRVRNGTIDPVHEDSPIKRIGGPGMVDVHLENVVLFEKADGTPHVIGPTTRFPAVLDGFERWRQVINLQDQVISLTVEGRTKDGVPVTAQDVQLVFSVARGGRKPDPDNTFQQPYPFVEQAIKDLVYKHGTGKWEDTMRSMIRSELAQFISQHTLSEFLSSPAGHLVEKTDDGFVPRAELTDLFYDFAKGFSSRAEERGVELQWIGVGTWVTPSEIIPEKHLEAWKLSSETRIRCSPEYLNNVQQDGRLAELMRMIDEIPGRFYQLRTEGEDGEALLRSMLMTYREKLRTARELYQSQEQPEPPELRAVLRHIDLASAPRAARNPED